MKRIRTSLIAILILLLVSTFHNKIYILVDDIYRYIHQKREATNTINEIIESNNYKYLFKLANMEFPPRKVIFVGIKDKHALEMWASENGNYYKLIYINDKFLTGDTTSDHGPSKPKNYEVPEGVFKLIGISAYQYLLIDADTGAKEASIIANMYKMNVFPHYIAGRRYSIFDKILLSSEIDVTRDDVVCMAYIIGASNVMYLISPTDFRENDVDIIYGSLDNKALMLKYKMLSDALNSISPPIESKRATSD